MLKTRLKYATLTDTDSDLDVVLITLAIRRKAMCEFQIAREQYDPFLLLDLIEQCGATHH